MVHSWYKGIYTAFALLVCSLALGIPDYTMAGPSIVVLGARTKTAHKQFVEGFKQYLNEQEAGVEFVDIALDDETENTDGLRQVVQEETVPLILTLGPKAFQSAVEQDASRPLIAGLTRDASALEKNHAATGVVLDYKVETQLSWITRLLPDARTIGVLYNPAESGDRVEAAKKAAARLNLKIVAQKVNSPDELPVAMESLFRSVDVLWGITDPVVLSRQTAKAILLTSFRNKVPFIAPSSAWVKAGALYSLEFDYNDIGIQTGEMARGVLRGQRVSSMPPQEPRKVRYSLNLRTAEHMRLNLSGEIVDHAVQVFK